MKQLLDELKHQTCGAFDTLVYLGAGDSSCLADLDGLNCRRSVLVEADPLNAESLIAQGRPGAEVINAMVSPSDGEVLFHRFTLPLVNGPLPRDKFVHVYPRLELVESVPLPGRTLPPLLHSLFISADTPNLLIIDLPGQEDALLAALTQQQTECFSYVLIRTFSENPTDSSREPASISHLANLGFDLFARDTTTNPAWPTFLLRKDAIKSGMQRELDERARILVAKATQIHQQGEQIAALTAERDTLSARVASLESENSDLATRHSSLATALEELQGRHSSLTTEREALQSELSAKSTLLDVLTKGRIAQDEQMEKLLQEEKNLISERDVLASRVSDLTSQVEKLEAHAKIIDEEFDKAEGQIELIKDIFLREAIR
jgi:hypothetical protein